MAKCVKYHFPQSFPKFLRFLATQTKNLTKFAKKTNFFSIFENNSQKNRITIKRSYHCQYDYLNFIKNLTTGLKQSFNRSISIPAKFKVQKCPI
jgi:hypothetical protein